VAGRIRQEDLEQVRQRTDIVQVVSGYLQLKKAGRDSLVGICPFHAEKTGSFSVSPGKQVYYCFGCGEHGDVFTFVEKVESLSFTEAVERLASQAGVTLRYEGQTDADRRAVGRRHALHRAVTEAAKLYQHALLESREAADARDYLRERGIGQASIERFEIGFAPNYPDYLLRRMARSVSPELLLEAGLVSRDEQGGMRDRFRGRVLFPIHDLSGNAVGFGGRLLAGPKAPANAAKYVNSPETPIYKKGFLLYNLNRAKAEATRTGRAFLVEGYTDVIAMDQAGIGSAVATCGTALGEEHLRLLARFTQRVILSFDSDEAGYRAAERAYAFHQRFPLDLSVLVLPEGQDPADFVLAHGEESGEMLEQLAGKAVPLVEYMIDRVLRGRDLTSLEERARAVRAGLELVLPLEDPVRRQEYARVLAGKVAEPEVSVMLQLERMTEAAGGAPATEPEPAVRRLAPWQKIEREAMKLLIQEPEKALPLAREVETDRFATASYRSAFEVVRDGLERGSTVPAMVAAAEERTRGEQVGSLIAALSIEPSTTLGEPSTEYVRQVFLELDGYALKREADRVRKELQTINPFEQPDRHTALFEELVRLEGARRRLRVEIEATGS
jgi:DNA primase